MLRTTDVYQQHHGQFSFFFKYFYIGLVVTSGHIPVDVSNVVSKLIIAHLAEGHSSSLERTVVFSRKNMVRETACFDLYFTDFFKYLFGLHFYM